MVRLGCAKSSLFYYASASVSLVERLLGANCYSKRVRLHCRSYSRCNVKMKTTFRFTDYDCIGFDLDNTLCRYKVENMVKMEYGCLVDFLLKRGYPGEYLLKPLDEDVDFVIRGLILDMQRGNLLRIAPNGYILQASHGTRQLHRDQIVEAYGTECRWQVTDVFSNNPLETWNGPLSQSMRTLLDYFDMPVSLVFARLVDAVDDQQLKLTPKYNVYPDILDALNDMFHKDHFALNKGSYFPQIKSNPDKYINKCSNNLLEWLKQLKQQNKVLFLITGSYKDFASHTASNSMGPKWRDLFDVVISFSKKPGFFTQSRPFCVDDLEVPVDQLRQGEIYTNGNWSGLQDFLKKVSGKSAPTVLYVGDNLLQDIYTPAALTNCDTVAVCEELEAEGVYGFERCHPDGDFLTSLRWGSFFYHKNKESSTIWTDFIRKYSKLCIPSVEFAAKYPIDYNFSSKSNFIY